MEQGESRIGELLCLLRLNYDASSSKRLLEAGQKLKRKLKGREKAEYAYTVRVEGERHLVREDLINGIEALAETDPRWALEYFVKLLLIPLEQTTLKDKLIVQSFCDILRNRARELLDMHEELIVGVIDMVGSTSDLIANVEGSPEDAAHIMQLLIEELQKKLPDFCRPIVFTGDGLLFIVQKPERPRSLATAIRGLPQALAEASDKDKLKKLMESSDTPVPGLRVALDAGQVYLGKVGPTENIVGLPVVVAARLCSEKDRYQEAGTYKVLATQRAVNRGAAWSVWQAGDFEPLQNGKFQPRGVGVKEYSLCRLREQAAR